MTSQDRAVKAIEHAAKRGYTPEQTARLLEVFELLAPDGMHWQEADYRPPGYYTVDELTERGPDLGDHVTRAKRLVGPWEKA